MSPQAHLAGTGEPKVTIPKSIPTPPPPAQVSSASKAILVVIFCFSNFLDAFNNSALFAAIPSISVQLNISNGESVWMLSAYQLTFAALLLTSGRLSDLYNPKWVYSIGMIFMASCGLGAGFIRSQVPLITLRALMGIGAALNIPAAMALIVRLFPDPGSQTKALSGFGAAAGLGNIFGLIIGALFTTFVSWPWIFYFSSIVAYCLGIIAFIILPTKAIGHEVNLSWEDRLKRLDVVGVTTLCAALLLFVFAVTSGSTDGWGTGRVIAPLIISILLVPAFLLWEARLPTVLAAVPPSIWKYENFLVIILVSLQPFMYWASIQLLFSWYYQLVFGWSAIKTAVHFLPQGLVAMVVMPPTTILMEKYSLKWIIFAGQVICVVGTCLLPFGDTKPHYWNFVFPGFLIGSAGMTIIFAGVNVAVFAVTPPEVAGVVGAIFQCALQLGGSAGAAIATSIQTSVQVNHGGPDGFQGRAAGLWFVFAVNALSMLGVAFLMKNTVPPAKKPKTEKSQPAVEKTPMDTVDVEFFHSEPELSKLDGQDMIPTEIRL
ncbi:MFS general substrate transporter [Ramaria rubella]|nr:MFS general substrate transporter [Ramaria rubella]